MINKSTKEKLEDETSHDGNKMIGAVPHSVVYNEDCVEGMKRFPDNYFDLAIVDKINMILLLLCQSIFVSLYQIKNI